MFATLKNRDYGLISPFLEGFISTKLRVRKNKTLEKKFRIYSKLSAYTNSCGGTLTKSSGQIQSPDEDNDGVFDYGVECEWTLLFENTLIELHILRLDLRTPSYENCDIYLQGDLNSTNRLHVSILVVCIIPRRDLIYHC